MSMRVISGKAAIAGVIGDPVGHSLSPALHNFWLEREKIDGLYIPLPIHHAHFQEAFPHLPEMGLKGCNITLPYKEEVMGMLDEIEPVAQAIGAVNTIIFENGRKIGTNTDAEGFIRSLDHAGDWRKSCRNALVLGAGGAAKAVAYGLREAGVTVHLTNRTHAKARDLAKAMQLEAVAWEKKEVLLPKMDLLVNTTTLGMAGQPEVPLDLANLSPQAWVADIVYHPLETALLKAAKAHGCTVVHGLGMLIFQAREGFRRWYGLQPTVDEETFLHLKMQLKA